MHGIVNSKILTIATVAGFFLVAGCASSDYGNAEYHVDAEERLLNMSCPEDRTAVCVRRTKQQIRCFCGDQDELERILQPDLLAR